MGHKNEQEEFGFLPIDSRWRIHDDETQAYLQSFMQFPFFINLPWIDVYVCVCVTQEERKQRVPAFLLFFLPINNWVLAT
jgi:hypothetical protein